jgi:deazaflavin-dependent oxidoreductase (nitroreductase family)
MRALVRRLAALAPVSRVLARILPTLDRAVHRLSRGRLTAAGALAGIPVAMVTTTGRRTGNPHTVPLLAVPLDGGWGVVASAFGSHRHPAWYANLQATPDATIEVRGRRYAVVASELSGTERDRLRHLAISIYPGFASYEKRVGARAIPYVRLTPVPDTRAGTP